MLTILINWKLFLFSVDDLNFSRQPLLHSSLPSVVQIQIFINQKNKLANKNKYLNVEFNFGIPFALVMVEMSKIKKFRVNGEFGMAKTKPREKSKGCYANYLKIGQNAFEFLLVFGHLYLDDSPVDQEALLHTKIITTPIYAKAFLKVLEDCIEHHERTFGAIPDDIVEFAMADQGWAYESEKIS